jgi:hypothetical protein
MCSVHGCKHTTDARVPSKLSIGQHGVAQRDTGRSPCFGDQYIPPTDAGLAAALKHARPEAGTPEYAEAIAEMNRYAAESALPLRTIGWDSDQSADAV